MADTEYNIGSTMNFEVTAESAAKIAAYIRMVDASEPWDLPNLDDPLIVLKEYYTKPAYKTLANGKRVKVRGPLAESLEAGLRDTVRVGKVRWVTVLDSNTAQRDRELDGTEWNADDISSPVPPLHINCRCKRVPIYNKRAYSA